MRKSHPVIAWRGQFTQDLPPDTRVTVPFRRVGIGLTSGGYSFVVSLLFLLFAATRYSLNAGYLLLFALGILLVLSALVGALRISGVTLEVKVKPPVKAGEVIPLQLVASSTSSKSDLELWIDGEPVFAAFNVKADMPTRIDLQLSPKARGIHGVGKIVLQTRQPLGLWRVYILWTPAMELVIYPEIERHAPPPSRPEARADDVPKALFKDGPLGEEEFAGLAPHQPGDSLRRLSWRTFAKSDGRVMATRIQSGTTQVAANAFTLGEALLAGDHERALSRLCAWVLAAERLGQPYTLDTMGEATPMRRGPQHLLDCLRQLAIYPTAAKEPA